MSALCRILQINSNMFSGSIPSTLGSLTGLTWVKLHKRDLCGCRMLSSCGVLVRPSTTAEPDRGCQCVLRCLCRGPCRLLTMGHNRLSGSIPSTLNNLSALA